MEEERRDRLSELQEEICKQKGVSSQTLQRLLDAVQQHSENQRGLPDELLEILKDEIKTKEGKEAS